MRSVLSVAAVNQYIAEKLECKLPLTRGRKKGPAGIADGTATRFTAVQNVGAAQSGAPLTPAARIVWHPPMGILF
jgi:hypothetical protein